MSCSVSTPSHNPGIPPGIAATSIASSTSLGVAPSVSFVGLKVLDRTGAGRTSDVQYVYMRNQADAGLELENEDSWWWFKRNSERVFNNAKTAGDRKTEVTVIWNRWRSQLFSWHPNILDFGDAGYWTSVADGLSDDPWPSISERLAPGVEPEGKVARVQDKGVVMDLGDEQVVGAAPRREQSAGGRASCKSLGVSTLRD